MPLRSPAVPDLRRHIEGLAIMQEMAIMSDIFDEGLAGTGLDGQRCAMLDMLL